MAKYFSYYEFIKSSTATKLGIDNNPTDETIQDNILELMGVMDKIRERWTDYCKENCLSDPAVIITSGYRCNALNKAVGGSKTSAHRVGAACDFEAKNGRNKDLFKVVQEVLKECQISFDQLIDEYDYSWIHLGLKNCSGERRNKVFSIKG